MDNRGNTVNDGIRPGCQKRHLITEVLLCFAIMSLPLITTEYSEEKKCPVLSKKEYTNVQTIKIFFSDIL